MPLALVADQVEDKAQVAAAETLAELEHQALLMVAVVEVETLASVKLLTAALSEAVTAAQEPQSLFSTT